MVLRVAVWWCVALVAARGGVVAAVRGASEPESTEFRCASGAVVPLERVNDDYCDCPEDGADEPGTAACAAVSDAASQRVAFRCGAAVASAPTWVFASRVDDGVCDCCDGSDEPAGVCADACAAYAAQASSEARTAGAARRAGYAKRREYACEALRGKAEGERESSESVSRIAADELALAAAEARLTVETTKRNELRDADALKRRNAALRLDSLDANALRTLLVDLARETGQGPALRALARVANGLPRVEPLNATLEAAEAEEPAAAAADKDSSAAAVEAEAEAEPDATVVSCDDSSADHASDEAESTSEEEVPVPEDSGEEALSSEVSPDEAAVAAEELSAEAAAEPFDEDRAATFDGGGDEGGGDDGDGATRGEGDELEYELVDEDAEDGDEPLYEDVDDLRDDEEEVDEEGNVVADAHAYDADFDFADDESEIPDEVFPDDEDSHYDGDDSGYDGDGDDFSYGEDEYSERDSEEDEEWHETSSVEPDVQLDLATYFADDADYVPARLAKSLKAQEREVSELKNALKKRRSKADKAQSKLGAEHYGPDGSLWVLREECLKQKASGYVYKICVFGDAKQGDTLLGRFDHADYAPSDDDTASSGAVTSLHYTGGAYCYNGPARTFRLDLRCGAEHAIKDIDEPSTCVYSATLETPCACERPPPEEGDAPTEPTCAFSADGAALPFRILKAARGWIPGL